MPDILQLASVARVAVAATVLVLTTQAGAVEIVGGTEADRQRMAEISDEWLMLRDMDNLDPG